MYKNSSDVSVCLAVLCFCRHKLYISHNGCSGWQRRVLGAQVAAVCVCVCVCSCVWPQASHSWPHRTLGLSELRPTETKAFCFNPCTDSHTFKCIKLQVSA